MIQSDKKLSVIVPVFNVQEYLRRCLDSILAQTYGDLEIICVDDGSTDGSGIILDEYVLKDARIKAIHKENGGLLSARKAGLGVATGAYVTYVDSDDWIEPAMYENMMDKMINCPVDLVASGFIRDYGSHIVFDPEKKSGLYTGNGLQKEIKEKLVDFAWPFRFSITASVCNKIFKTDMLKEFQLCIPNEVTLDEDTVCSYPYLLQCNGIYVMKECYYHYCQRTDSLLLNTEISKEVQCNAIQRAYQHARGVLPADITEYLETYIWLTVCPEHVMQYAKGEMFPFGAMEPNSKVVVYSCGSFGRHAKIFIEENTDLQVVAWVDKGGDGVTILRQEQLPFIECDYILVCVLLADIVADICKDFEKLGIDMRKVRCIRDLRMPEPGSFGRDSRNAEFAMSMNGRRIQS